MSRGMIHRNGSVPPATPAEFSAVAAEASARGLDLGVRRRVGFVRHHSGGSVEVVAFDGEVTKFPNSHQPFVRALDADEQASLLRRLTA